MDALVGDTEGWANDLLGPGGDTSKIRQALEEAHRWEDEHFTREAARVWAKGFRISEDKVLDDLKRFKAAGRDLEKMARRQLAGLSPHRRGFLGLASNRRGEEGDTDDHRRDQVKGAT